MKRFECNHCDKTFYEAKELRIHISGIHETIEKNHHCDHCEKSFVSSPNLKRHVKIEHYDY